VIITVRIPDRDTGALGWEVPDEVLEAFGFPPPKEMESAVKIPMERFLTALTTALLSDRDSARAGMAELVRGADRCLQVTAKRRR
jgi:hypothetical protein